MKLHSFVTILNPLFNILCSLGSNSCNRTVTGLDITKESIQQKQTSYPSFQQACLFSFIFSFEVEKPFYVTVVNVIE